MKRKLVICPFHKKCRPQNPCPHINVHSIIVERIGNGGCRGHCYNGAALAFVDVQEHFSCIPATEAEIFEARIKEL